MNYHNNSIFMVLFQAIDKSSQKSQDGLRIVVNFKLNVQQQNNMDIESVIFVVCVSLVILTISSAYINIFIAALFHQDLTYFFIYFPIYASVLILLLVSYYRAVFNSPGFTNPAYNSQYSDLQIQVFKENAQKQKIRKQQRQRTGNHLADKKQIQQLMQIAFCKICEAVKPPRAHHCKVCQKCIVRMDHHCPWVGNCVGQQNNKYFILFLLYATVGLSMTWITLCIDSFEGWKYVSTFKDQDIAINVMIIVIIASVLLSLSIGTLFITQIIGIKQNITTLESFIPSIEDNSPFDTGSFYQNGREIFGSKCWWIPLKPEFDGLKY